MGGRQDFRSGETRRYDAELFTHLICGLFRHVPEGGQFTRRKGEKIPDAVSLLVQKGKASAYASLFIDIGTPTEEVANALVHHNGLRIITNNLNMAKILCENKNFEVIVAGGKYGSFCHALISASG